ncbi:hypothetical protein BH09PAT3_BH09PAT3_6020 [soil metagenome]
MVKMVVHTYKRFLTITGLAILLSLGLFGSVAHAADTTQNPQAGSVGLEGTISTTPPTRGATITTPGNGASFSTTPITVAGLCPADTLVKIFDNNVFVGSALCINGSYSLQIDLFGGSNQLVARVYDALDQAGPDSNTVTVQFNDAQFAQYGSRVTLTSIYARRGAFPGTELVWPLVLSGGVGPYAVSIDWGDGSAPQLMSLTSAGSFDIKHKYTNAGYYKVVVRATDKNGTTAFLQLVAVANGAAQSGGTADKDGGSSSLKTIVIWWPVLLMLPLLFIAFWLGRRHELYVLRQQLESAKQQ